MTQAAQTQGFFSQLRVIVAAGAVSLSSGVWAQDLYAPNEVWKPRSDGMNLSTFTYMDRNENGTYDLGDQPLAGIYYQVRKDGNVLSQAESNKNGFANFKASRVSPEAIIYDVGDYTFEVLLPPYWTVTSGNGTQTRRFGDIEGAAMGGGLDNMMEPVGLVPPKSIRGRTEPGRLVFISGPDVPLTQVEVAPDGRFNLIVPTRGQYTLTSGSTSISVSIAEFPVDIGTLRSQRPMQGSKNTVSFDDITDGSVRKIPNGYGGLEWFNLNAIRNIFERFSRGYVNGATSGSFTAYTSSGHPALISHPDGFDFVQMNVSTSWRNAEGETAVFEFFRDGELIAVDEVTLSIYSPVVYTPRVNDVTEVRISTRHYWQLVMDDFVFGLKY